MNTLISTRKSRIEHHLHEHFSPIYIEVIDETHQHASKGRLETHFKVTLVSKKFHELTLIQRHRQVNQLMQEELRAGLHALSLHLYTPSEWQERAAPSPLSPVCKGGEKH